MPRLWAPWCPKRGDADRRCQSAAAAQEVADRDAEGGEQRPDAGLPEYGGAPIDGPGGSIAGVRWGGSFEGETQAFVGTSDRLPFRVAVLGGPNRVYIDVAQV